MPKLIVLTFGADASSTTLAQAVAEGAKDIRFMEVDVRDASNVDGARDGQSQRRALPGAEHVTEYDGVILCASTDAGSSSSLATFLGLLDALAPANRFANTVFAIVGSDASVLGRVAALGGIVVSAPRGIEGDESRARAHGARAAKVVGWVRHALGHEQADHAHEHHHHH